MLLNGDVRLSLSRENRRFRKMNVLSFLINALIDRLEK